MVAYWVLERDGVADHPPDLSVAVRAEAEQAGLSTSFGLVALQPEALEVGVLRLRRHQIENEAEILGRASLLVDERMCGRRRLRTPLP
jgi:hypothetical protein